MLIVYTADDEVEEEEHRREMWQFYVDFVSFFISFT